MMIKFKFIQVNVEGKINFNVVKLQNIVKQVCSFLCKMLFLRAHVTFTCNCVET